MKPALSLLVSFGYAGVLVPMALWGANEGPTLLFRLSWIVLLLAYAVIQTSLRPEPDPRLRQIPFFRYIFLGTVLGYLFGSAMIGFDNTGFGSFLSVMLAVGAFSALMALCVRLWYRFTARQPEPEP